MSALGLIEFVYLIPICKNHLPRNQWQAGGLILVLTGKADWEFRRCGMFSFSDNTSQKSLKSECKAFCKLAQENRTSRIGLQDDGTFVITIV